MSIEISLLQAINTKDKSDIPEYLQYQDRGYIYSEMGKLHGKSNIILLHITSYFFTDVIYYSYILLKIQCNLTILHIKLLIN